MSSSSKEDYQEKRARKRSLRKMDVSYLLNSPKRFREDDNSDQSRSRPREGPSNSDMHSGISRSAIEESAQPKGTSSESDHEITPGPPEREVIHESRRSTSQFASDGVCGTQLPRLYRCSICGDRLKNLARHMNKVKHKCQHEGCSYVHCYASKIRQHEISHVPREQRQVECEICRRKFVRQSNLNRHKRFCHPENGQ